MHKNELFNVLRTFSKIEIRKFKKFLNSDYFGRRSKAAELLDIVLEYHPMYSDTISLKAEIISRLYSGKSCSSSTIRNLFSDLHGAAIHFLTIKNYEESAREKDFFLFNELKAKGLNGEFHKIIDKLEPQFEGHVDWVYFLGKHFRESNRFNFSHHGSKMKKQIVLGSELSYLSASVNDLIYFFVMELTSIYLNYVFFKDSFNTGTISENISRTLSLIDFSKVKEILKDDKYLFVINIYEALLEAYKTPYDVSKYHTYKQMVKESFRSLSRDERSFHYSKMFTYCIIGGQNKFTEYDYDAELEQLYREMLENKYYIDRNTAHLPHELYRNILTFAIRIKNFQWVEEFVSKYSFRVFPQDRENMFYYGNAYLSFERGEYRTALEHLNNIDLDFFIYKVDVKNLRLRIYYELNDIEAALDMITSYREFIRKNKLLNPERKKRYINFSKFLEKLVLYKAGTLKHDIGYIRYRLKNAEALAFKPWLTEKISSFKTPAKKSA